MLSDPRNASDCVPPQVLEDIQAHYRLSVANAQERYERSREDEDALTGDLGGALEGHTIREVGKATYSVRTKYHKLRGKGAGAAEKTTGADSIFEIEVRDSTGNILCRKGLLFQAKKNWTSSDGHLRAQVQDSNSIGYRDIFGTVCDLVEKPRVGRKEMRVWDGEQAQMFLATAKRLSSPYYPLYLTAITTGLRAGELLGLRWSSMDFLLGTARVDHTFYRMGGEQLFQEPKTEKGRRVVDLLVH